MSDTRQHQEFRGRGAQLQTANRFERLHTEGDFEHLELLFEAEAGSNSFATQYLPDNSQQIKQTFNVFAKKHGLHSRLPPLSTEGFRRPGASVGQGWLF